MNKVVTRIQDTDDGRDYQYFIFMDDRTEVNLTASFVETLEVSRSATARFGEPHSEITRDDETATIKINTWQ